MTRIFALLTSIILSFSVFATEQSCSRAALDERNFSDDDKEKYLAYFSREQNQQALNALSQVELDVAAMEKYQDEIQSLSDDREYQPTLAFCNDFNNVMDAYEKELADIAKQYGYKGK